ncbi:MAG: DUF4365 domain-containing protein [Candidatus Shapirobacteria bacterium]
MSRKIGKQNNNLITPGIHPISSNIDVAAISLVNSILASNGGCSPDLKSRDTWPNTDGNIELLTATGEPDGLLTTQVKQVKVGKKSISYTFKNNKFVNYCKRERGLPVIFIGVDLNNQKAYWLEMSLSYANSVKSKTIHILKENVIEQGNVSYLPVWKYICDNRKRLIESGLGYDFSNNKLNLQKSAITQLYTVLPQSELLQKNVDAVNSIINDIKEKILSYEGILFLVSPTYINNAKTRGIIRKILSITVQQEDLFIDELGKKGILVKTGDIVSFQEDSLGREKVSFLFTNSLLDITKIYISFDDIKIRKTILNKIAGIHGIKQIDDFFGKISKEFLDKLIKIKSNDDIKTNLELLEEYSFRVPKQAIKIVERIVGMGPISTKKHNSGIGKFDGASTENVLNESLEVLNNIRYIEIKSTFEIAVKLSNHSNPNVRKKAFDLIKSTSQYNIFAIKKIGYYPQQQIISILKKWGLDKTKQNINIFLEVGKELLDSEREGSRMTDYRTFTLSFGPLVASKELVTIRNKMAELLESIYSKSKNVQVKKQILDTLEAGSRTPNRGEYSNELEQMIIDFVGKLVKFYIKVSMTADFTLLYEVEEQLNWFSKRFGEEKIKNIEKLRKIIELNKYFQIFKVLYGYDLGYNNLPWREARELREGQINKLIDEITEENFDNWEQNILGFAGSYSDSSYDKYQYFNLFLYRFSKQKPIFGIELLKNYKVLTPFLLSVLRGLWESDQHVEVNQILYKWVRESKCLSVIAGVFWYIEKPDLKLIDLLISKAKDNKDINALVTLVRSIPNLYKHEKLVKRPFIQAIGLLTRLNEFRWITNIYLPEPNLIESFNEKEADIILKNFVIADDLNYDAQEILATIAKKFPKKVIECFEKRIVKQMKKKKDVRYDALPFDLHELPEVPEIKTEAILNMVLDWFRNDGWLFQFDGARFLKDIFPSMGEPLKSKLLSLIKEGGKNNADTVLCVLREFEGETFLHPIVKSFVKKYLKSKNSKLYKEYLTELYIVLSKTGVVSGEFGLPNAYKQRKEMIQPWKLDKSKLIKDFVVQYESYLDKDITYHTKRAEEDIELMKRGSL